jgi:hypothetical protein
LIPFKVEAVTVEGWFWRGSKRNFSFSETESDIVDREELTTISVEQKRALKEQKRSERKPLNRQTGMKQLVTDGIFY